MYRICTALIWFVAACWSGGDDGDYPVVPRGTSTIGASAPGTPDAGVGDAGVGDAGVGDAGVGDASGSIDAPIGLPDSAGGSIDAPL
ncbi:MAG: hypothetical protein H0T42_33825 [Deltaproteobacteria bacterium]|nr:hypothetical protein [Deltaproteobacteria bacterium]